MNLADIFLRANSGITKRIPYIRGLGRFYEFTNNRILELGADPIVTARMKDGTKIIVDLRSKTEIPAYYRGEYDLFFIDIIRSILNPDSCFLDIGANIGFFTIAIGSFMESNSQIGKVIAFEPFIGNYKRLVENIKFNALNKICFTHNIGLSNKYTNSFITLRKDFLNGSETGNASIEINEQFDSGFEKVNIQLVQLDEVWNENYCEMGNIDVIKMDIEGHEDFCFEGGKKVIESHRPTILMEVNKAYYKARGVDLDNRFSSLIPENYRIYKRSKSSWKLITSFNDCNNFENVFLIPLEKLRLQKYNIFSKGKNI